MTNWPSKKSRLVLRALLNIGWKMKRQHGSHVVLGRSDWIDYVWAFHDNEEIGPVMLARIARKTGLRPENL